METLTYQHREQSRPVQLCPVQHRPEQHRPVQPDSWLYEIKQKGNSQTCYVMVKVRTSSIFKVGGTKLVFPVRKHLSKPFRLSCDESMNDKRGDDKFHFVVSSFFFVQISR